MLIGILRLAQEQPHEPASAKAAGQGAVGVRSCTVNLAQAFRRIFETTIHVLCLARPLIMRKLELSEPW